MRAFLVGCVLAGMLIAPASAVPPRVGGWGTAIVDGAVAGSEWAGASRTNLTLHGLDGSSGRATLLVMNDSHALYVALEVPRTLTESASAAADAVSISFDSNHDGRLDERDDLIYLERVHLPQSRPKVSYGDEYYCGSSCVADDIDGAGSSNVKGDVRDDVQLTYYEVVHKLNGDDFDVAPDPQHTTAIFIRYRICPEATVQRGLLCAESGHDAVDAHDTFWPSTTFSRGAALAFMAGGAASASTQTAQTHVELGSATIVAPRIFPPQAGAAFEIRVKNVALKGSTRTVVPSSTSCHAAIGATTLVGSGTGGCTWEIPASARGRRLSLTITVAYGGGSRTYHQNLSIT